MNKENLISEFRNPGIKYRAKPFWSWNGELDRDELKRQVRVMKEMGFGGYFMHSRAGLITEYLGDEWFDLINEVADEGERLGMESWLYDEDRWPSGSAGGKVTVDPQYRKRDLILYEMPADEYKYSADDFKVYYGKIDGVNIYDYYEVTDGVLPQKAYEEGYKVLVFRVVMDSPSSTYNGTTYIDVLSYKAVYKFIELTHEEYKKRCGDRLGRTIKGIFTDEPNRGHLLDNLRTEGNVRKCSICYTDDIFDEFLKRYGYDALEVLPEIFYRKDGNMMVKVKHDFVDLANALFIERFAMPINEWCKKNNIEFTGHVLHEDSLTNQTVPNGSLMRFYEHMGYPGVDVLTEWNNGYCIVKQLKSSARQLGKEWLLSELYGCTGWQFNFEGHKAVGDWQALLGINLRCPHLSWYSMEGESKRDYPASILHQATYYKDYNYVESYFARFGLMMKQGKTVCDCLVLNPIESIWGMMHIGWAGWIIARTPEVQKLEREYDKLLHSLADNQIDFDYGDEEMMSRLASVEMTENGPVLKIGQASYRTVVIGGMLTMRSSTYNLIKKFSDLGGTVIFAGYHPSYIDCENTGLIEELAKAESSVSVPFESAEIAKAVKTNEHFTVKVIGEKGEQAPHILSQASVDEEGNIYVAILNTSRKEAEDNLKLVISDMDGRINKVVSCEEWDLRNGSRYAQECSFNDGFIEVPVDFYKNGEHIFVFATEKDADLQKKETCGKIISEYKLEPGFSYSLDEKNVCVIDFCKFRIDNGEWEGPLEVLKADRRIREIFGLEHRGGGMLQPWYSKINDKKIYGKIDLEFEFYADIIPEGPVFLAVERPEFCSYSLNGIQLEYDEKDGFFVDFCMKKLRIPEGAIKSGRNVITMHTDFKRTTNIETIYLSGDFGVSIDGHKATLMDLPSEIGFDNLREYNLPFYTGCVSYRIDPSKYYVKGKKLILKVDSFSGSLVKVTRAGSLNDSEKIVLGWDPYEADITYFASSGEMIDVTLVCNRKNMFGPLHQIPAVPGATGPENFTTGGKDSWNDDYVLMDSKIGGITVSVAE